MPIKPTPSEIEKISAALISRFDTAWNGRDAEALAELFTDEADFQFYYGHLARGRDKIRRYYATKVFPYLAENLRHITRSSKTRVLAEGALIGDGRVDLVEVDEKGSELKVQRRLKVTTVVVQAGGDWKFAAVRMMVPVKE